ncbi:MAG: hypothetical protein ACE5I1_32075, partial [bacterium]
TRDAFRQAKTDQERDAVREKLIARYRDVRSLRRILGLAFRGDSQGSLATPGDYLIKMSVNGNIHTGKLTVREDPMLAVRR